MHAANLNELLWLEFAQPTAKAKAKGLVLDAPHWSDLDVADVLERALAADPEDIQRWYALVDHWLEKGNFIRAAAILDDAIARFPNAAGAYSRRADALTALDPARSAEDNARSIALGGTSLPKPLEVSFEQPAPTDAVATVYADITDLMEYLTSNISMSGIQRVVANLLRCGMDHTSPNARNVQPVIPDYMDKVVYKVDMALVRELVDAVELRVPNRDHLNRLISAIWVSRRAIVPDPGSIILLAGAFWIVNSFDLLKSLRQRGVIITIFIHDLIQIDSPEFVHKHATMSFRRGLLDVGEIANFFTTNSAYVARVLRRFLRREIGLDTPVLPVPLATEMKLSPPEPWAEESLRAEFDETGYVLCVCTIEIRKNHIYLMRIWQELMRRGRTDLPKLVFVGKLGWDIDYLQSILDETNYLDGMVKVMTGLSDAELVSLYRNSRFTMYPSFTEGWGLPIGESLVFGKPCIAAGVTSMPEVGGSLVRYIDPLNLDTGIAEVTRLLDNPDTIAAWEKQIEERFQPRSWADFAEMLLGGSRALAKSTGDVPIAFARIRPGELAIMGNDSARLAADAGLNIRSARMAREDGWLHLNDGGAWSARPLASLRFLAEGCMPGEKIRVALRLRGDRDHNLGTCQLRSSLQVTEFRALDAAPSLHSVNAVVAADGTVDISILVTGEPALVFEQKAYARLSGLGFHREGRDDEALKLMEAATFRP